jgi:hypothetical protein
MRRASVSVNLSLATTRPPTRTAVARLAAL